MEPVDARYEAVKREWVDQYVEVSTQRPELRRFAGVVGRVVTVNRNLRALVDFQDGGWYDIGTDALVKLDAATAKEKFDAQVNSAQPYPARQS